MSAPFNGLRAILQLFSRLFRAFWWPDRRRQITLEDRERDVERMGDPAGSDPAVCAGAGTADVEVILIVGFFSGVVAVDEGEIDPEFLARDACHRCGVIIDIACFIEDRRGAIA